MGRNKRISREAQGMRLHCNQCRMWILTIPKFTPNSDLKQFLILFKCPYCKESRVIEININKAESGQEE